MRGLISPKRHFSIYLHRDLNCNLRDGMLATGTDIATARTENRETEKPRFAYKLTRLS
jgi:hypothetical protein